MCTWEITREFWFQKHFHSQHNWSKRALNGLNVLLFKAPWQCKNTYNSFNNADTAWIRTEMKHVEADQPNPKPLSKGLPQTPLKLALTTENTHTGRFGLTSTCYIITIRNEDNNKPIKFTFGLWKGFQVCAFIAADYLLS